jgi:nucleoside-diphosphate-sugar epimerase
MARTALIIGGSGQIGQAAARRLLAGGWAVTTAQQHPENLPADLTARGVRALALDRQATGALAALVAAAGGFDAVIDTVAFDDLHAGQLLEIQADVGALVVISSGSVYRDEDGRTLDEAAQTGFPRFPVPITEDQPTVTPGDANYSTRKALLEQTLLQRATVPVAILRAGAIYGPGSRHPREWWFVKRILDGRRRVPLAYDGQSRFHGSATANLAELALAAIEARRTLVLNAADPRALTVQAMGAAIAAAYGADLEFAPFRGPPKGPVGSHPWAVAGPVVFDMARAEAIGYRPVTRYEDAIGEACRSAEAAAAAGVAFPDYIDALFDYATEDAFFGKV